MNKIIYIFFIIVFLIKTGNVFSDTKIFNVDNIVVDNVNNQNKEKLLDEAFIKGFSKLTERILQKKDILAVSNTSIGDVRKLISSYKIIEERDYKKQDKVTINLIFNRERINDFLFKRNMSYSDISKTSLFIFPVLIEGGNFYLFSDNYFYSNWNTKKSKEDENGFITYILPFENLETIELINQNKDNLQLIEIDKILDSSSIKNYIFLVIEPLEKNIKVFLKGSFDNNKINKNFYIKIDNFNKNLSFEKAVEEIKKEINEIWKIQNLIDLTTPSFLNTTLEITDKKDLLNLQNSLNDIDLIQNFYVLELNKDYAKIKIKYIGNIDKLKSKFFEKGIEIKIANQEWQLGII